MGHPDTTDRKIRRRQLAKRENACARCTPHDGENRERRPRDDRHKDHRRTAPPAEVDDAI